MSAELISPEGWERKICSRSHLGLKMAIFSVFSHYLPSLYICAQTSSCYKYTSYIELGPIVFSFTYISAYLLILIMVNQKIFPLYIYLPHFSIFPNVLRGCFTWPTSHMTGFFKIILENRTWNKNEVGAFMLWSPPRAGRMREYTGVASALKWRS